MSRAQELQALFVRCVATGRIPARYEELLDEVEAGQRPVNDLGPSDREILDVYVEAFGGTHLEGIERLIQLDFVTLRNSLTQG